MIKWIVKGKKKGKDSPFKDSKSIIIWDGVNREITLSTCNFTESQAQILADNIKKNDIEGRWKIWIEQIK